MANAKKALAPGTRIDSDDAPDLYWDGLPAVVADNVHTRHLDIRVQGENVRDGIKTRFGEKTRLIVPVPEGKTLPTISRDGDIGTSDTAVGIWLPLRFGNALLQREGEVIRISKSEAMKGNKVTRTEYRAEIPDRRTESAGE